MNAGDLQIGTRIREYQILELIGKGGMGAVYKARHTYLNKIRAIKIIRTVLATESDFVERFIREARILSELNHPNLVQLYEFGSLDNDSFFMVLEFVQGQSLLQRIREMGRIPVGLAIQIVQQAAWGLQSAHQLGIVHRDISPDNILLVKDSAGKETVKVIDFGIAKALLESSQHLTATHMFIGKPEYSSPEQCGMTPEAQVIDHRTDIYSLGITLYYMLSGKLPFYSPTPQGYLIKHATEQPKPLMAHLSHEHVPATLDAVITKALAKAREDRFQSMKDFAESLQHVAAELDECERNRLSTDRDQNFQHFFETGKQSFERSEWDDAINWWNKALAIYSDAVIREWIQAAEERKLGAIQLRNSVLVGLADCESRMNRSDYGSASKILDQLQARMGSEAHLSDLQNQVNTLRQKIDTRKYDRTQRAAVSAQTSKILWLIGGLLLVMFVIGVSVLASYLVQERKQKRREEMVRRFELLLEQGELSTAKQRLSEIEKAGDAGPLVLELQNRYRISETQRAKTLLEEAETAYSQGNRTVAENKIAELENARIPGFEEAALSFRYRMRYASAEVQQNPYSDSAIAERTRTALMWEMYNGNVEEARILIQNGSRINAADGNGLTVLMYAIWKTPQLVDELIRRGASVNAKNKQAVTPLLMAADKGEIGATQALIQAGGDVNAQNSYGSTPLILATMQGHIEVVRLLLQAGADTYKSTYNGYDVLRTAREYNRSEIERIILQSRK